MKKLPLHLENPVDNSIYYIIEKIEKTVYSVGLTPNMLTTIGNIFTIIFVYLFLKKKYVLASFAFFMSYFFDCLDGYIARSYNMVTIFGDYYDHISDFTKLLITSYLLISRVKMNMNSLILLLITLIMLTFTLFFFNNQEIYYGNPESSPTLSFLTSFKRSNKTKSEAIQSLKFYRFFGCGTITLYSSIIIGAFKYISK
jgi:phosphatidylglycerophosphate synthase